MEANIIKLKLTQITVSPDCQARTAISEDTVEDYTEVLRKGGAFPPVVVYSDDTNYWLADGFHRFHAHERAALVEIEAEVRRGGHRKARLTAVGANATHGLRRTNADKRRAVEILLSDEEWRQWSDREIERVSGVSAKTVAAIRTATAEILSCDPKQANFDDLRRGADGKVRRMPRKKAVLSRVISPIAGETTVLPPPEQETGFNISQAERELIDTLAAMMTKWPKEKQHAYCVMVRNFTSSHDPEFPLRRLDAIDRAFMPAPGGAR
jgi:ParB-like nuclease domain